MTLLFDAAEPRPEVLSGTLTEAIFAASLDEVVSNTAPPAYGEPAVFFDATHPSGGLRSLLNESLGRIGGKKPDAAPVIRLETNLGGGKTHNLIALYHAAQGGLDQQRAKGFMDPALLPDDPVKQIGVFVGTSAGATSFEEIDGVKPQTPWGSLALQLGGRGAYEHVKNDDEGRTAPGSRDLKKVFGGKPSLVLVDELARYLQTADGVTVGKGTLADQTVSFLMALMEAAAGEPHTCVVLTMTESTDPFGGDTQRMLDAFDEAQELIGRRAQSLRPSDEADLPKILSRRLFSKVNASAAKETASAYGEAIQDAYARGTDLPDRMTSSGEWQSEVEASYPFHPDLIRILDKRLSTIPNFQRTRGALRLLARAVRLTWDQRPEGTLLIHPHHIGLHDPEIAEELSSRLDRPRWEPVIRTDIASRPGGEASHAEMVDRQMGSSYGVRLATALYLYSLTAETPGVPAPGLIGSVLAPGDDPGVVTKALDQLEQSCWHMHTDVRGYRFSTEANLLKMVDEAERRIPLGKVKQAATDVLARQFRDSALKVKRGWEDPKVPDHSDDAFLVLIHWDELQIDDPTGPVPAKIHELWEKTPAGGNRTFRNRLLFLASNATTHDSMIRAVRRHLALQELAKSDTAATLSPDKRTELKNKARESELEARVSVCNHVNVLFVPEAGGLQGYGLDIVTQASLKPNQTEAVLERLAAMEKTLAAGDKPLDPHYIRSKLGAQLDSGVSTEELVRVFARRSDLKLVLDKAMIRQLVSDGIRQGVWDYQDAERGDEGWATKDRPNASVRIADDTYVHPSGTAPEPTPVACPICGLVHTGACPGPGPGPIPPAPSASTFEGTGTAAVAVSSAKQAALDAHRSEIHRVRAAVVVNGEGTGVQLARLLALFPQKDAQLLYQVDATVELDDPKHWLKIDFAGTPSEYQQIKAVLDQVLRARQGVLRASVDALLDPPWAISGQEAEDLYRRAQETGPSACRIELVTEGTS